MPVHSDLLRITRPLLFVIATIALQGSASATVIYSNYGPGFTGQNGGLVVGCSCNSDPNPTKYVAMPFTPSETSMLTGIAATIVPFLAHTVDLDVQLAADDHGLPGATIEGFHSDASRPVPVMGVYLPPLTFQSSLNPELVAGQQYWLVAEATFLGGGDYWQQSSSDFGVIAQHDTTGWTTRQSARGLFQIEGAPEPASMTLFLAGLSAAFLSPRARRWSHRSRRSRHL